ncbi:MAG: ATP-dependent DNA helicase RecG [Pseudomonadaceae bacterium]|nr:ATP-dependent DNA helicase RecG [Pseudomonadaceae bacterium]
MSALLHNLPLTKLKGVGQALEEKLQRLGIQDMQGLLFHLPLRYEDHTQISPLGSLRVSSTAVVEGEVVANQVIVGRRRSLLVRIRDATGLLSLRFFHFSATMKKQLEVGCWLRCYGEARPGATGLEMYHPEFKVLSQELATPALEQGLTPVYPITEGFQQQRLRQLVQQALGYLASHPPEELLPLEIQQTQVFPRLVDALHYLHQPPANADLALLESGLHPAQRRLALEELLAQQLGMLILRQQSRSQAACPLLPYQVANDISLEEKFLASLPFKPTKAQERVTAEIFYDLQLPHPMLRLVQGDVGSGKTLVAAMACLRAITAGYQAALMAPTELLADQHFQNLSNWLEPLSVKVGWLTGRMKGKAREAVLAKLASGETHLLIGTHALFQDEVVFQRLALVVIDEQHRFGVHQRLALRNKGVQGQFLPHQLVMTATPIPRTLAMSAYADLDISVIDELPPGRQPVTTLVLPDTRRAEVVARVRHACLEGRQAYWVCTLIEESEALECQAAEVTAEELRVALPELNVGLVHGRLKAAEKAAVMEAFKQGEYQLLVATTVIEVGVDVPNASLMIIDNAERLGLAQLHQLRGRVGRGSTASFCVLVYHPPLSAHGRERLQVMRETNDGFVVAQKDLEIRGPGEMLGTRQTGEIELRIADLKRDTDLLIGLKPVAQRLLEDLPDQAQRLLVRWRGNQVCFAQV